MPLGKTRSDLSEVPEPGASIPSSTARASASPPFQLRRPAFGVEMDELERVLERPIGKLAGAWKSSSADLLDDARWQVLIDGGSINRR